MNYRTLLAPAILGALLVSGGCASMGNYGGAHTGVHTDGSMMGNHPMHEMGDGHQAHPMHDGMAMHNRARHGDPEADAAAAAATLQAYSAAINAEDIDAMAAQVVADERFSVIEGGGTNSGWVDYRDHHIGPEFASERIDFHVYGYHDIDMRVGHMFAYATFTYAFEATLDGEPYNKEGRGTAVLMRTPEGWRIRHIQTS